MGNSMVDNMQLISQLPGHKKSQILCHLQEDSISTSRDGESVSASEVSGTSRQDQDGAALGGSLHRNGGVLVREAFLPASWNAEAARLEAQQLLSEQSKAAGIGGRECVQKDQVARGDRMRWLNIEQMSDGPLRVAVDALCSLKQGLAMWGYDTGGRTSVQLSLYPGNGARYVCHTDASDSAPTRTITAILYLNPEWDLQNGGQLCLYSLAQRWSPGKPLRDTGKGYMAGQPALLIPPLANRLVLFDSSIPHEVLPSHSPRYALTVWFHSGHTPKVPLQDSSPVTLLERPLTSMPSLAEERIFVSIAAFRDPETRWTVRELLAKAAHPDRLRIGIVWQVDVQEDAEFLELPCTPAQKAQIRQIVLDYREATGPCKARMLAQKLWAGEEYVLQIDSHMRFAPGWDQVLIQWLADCERQAEHGKAVLSTYPPAYEGNGPSARIPDDDRPTLLRASHFGPEGMLRLVGSRLAEAASRPVPSLFWAAGFSFSHSQLIREVPYEELPYLFFGEEQYMLARMWMHGWDMFAPPKSIAFHLWSRAERNTFFSCVPQDAILKEQSQNVVLVLFSKCDRTGHEASTEIGLGINKARSLSSLEAHCGVQYNARKIGDAGRRGTAAANVTLTFAQTKDIVVGAM